MAEASQLSSKANPQKSIGHRVGMYAKGLSFMTLWCVAIFAGAGQVTWTRGWLCLALYVLMMSITGAVVGKYNPELVKERSKMIRKDTKPFDKVILSLFLPLTMVQPVIAGLDAVRFGWSSMPSWVLYPGIVVFMLSVALICWVMVKNPHAEASVRIQSDRNHTVITAGPYRLVRHPMYSGAILMYASTALILGSLWALILAAIIAFLLLWRTALEDKTLRRELPGYEEYTTITRYRLIPGIW
jgi:protein-S-isoprenylcysteine O-methyltransferase Ste14